MGDGRDILVAVLLIVLWIFIVGIAVMILVEQAI
jgi:hypothetical protein